MARLCACSQLTRTKVTLLLYLRMVVGRSHVWVMQEKPNLMLPATTAAAGGDGSVWEKVARLVLTDEVRETVSKVEIAMATKLLHAFDMNATFGPKSDMSRVKRWMRAYKLQLHPPPIILGLEMTLLQSTKPQPSCAHHPHRATDRSSESASLALAMASKDKLNGRENAKWVLSHRECENIKNNRCSICRE